MRTFVSAIVFAVVFGIFADRAAAQDIFAPRMIGVDKLVGAVAVIVPDYEGSDDYTFAAAPLIQYKFSPSNRYVQLIGNKLYVNVINHENWEFGPMGIYRLGREDVDDNVVDKMSDVDDSAELGLFFGYATKFNNNPRHRLNIHLDVTQDVSGGHEGLIAQFAGVYWQPVAKPFDIGFRANLTFASGDYMSSFFDVTANDAAASGLQRFDADASLKDFGLAIMGLFHFNKQWHVGGGVQWKQLRGDATNSPVVNVRGDSGQYFAGMSVLYSW
jgi:outer membrane protein